jgi:hypothetical protein
MRRRISGESVLAIDAYVDAGEYWLCALWDDGDIVHASINRYHMALATVHAEHHAERGIPIVQLCGIDCQGD